MNIDKLNTTKGPFVATLGEWVWSVRWEAGEMAKITNVSSVSHERQKHNAHLIAHWLNMGPKLLKALELARLQLREQTTFGGKYPEINGTELVRDSHKVMTAIRPVLEEASTVEAI